MKKVVLIATGGTIASKPNPKTGLLSAGVLTGEELATICNLPSNVEIIIESIFQIPSPYFTFNKWIILKEKIEDFLTDSSIDGIVVTQGTDTLEETAYFLDITVSTNKPIVITGSQRGPSELGSDAYSNIRQAILTAIDHSSQNLGCIVLFNERIFSARYVQKVHASNIAGFTSHGFGYLGVVDKDRVIIYQKPIKRELYSLPNRSNLKIPKVDILKFYADADDKYIRCAIAEGVDGLILEGMGRGHVPSKVVNAISSAIQNEMKIVITTSALEGEVYPIYDYVGSVFDLQNRGAIVGRDYDSKKARIKLAVQLMAGVEVDFSE